jgi:hypothetical protein
VDEAKTGVVQVICCLPLDVREMSTSLRGPAPSLIWVHGQWSGDMMMDGVPDVRAAEGCDRSFFPGSPPNSGVATGKLRKLAAGIS